MHYDDGVPGVLTTVHGHQLSDGTYINFTRTIPNGGVHVVKQDSKTLRRTEVGCRTAERGKGYGTPVQYKSEASSTLSAS